MTYYKSDNCYGKSGNSIWINNDSMDSYIYFISKEVKKLC